MGRLGRRPGALAGLEGQHERDLGRGQGVGEAGVVAVEAVGHHRPEPDAGLLGSLLSLLGYSSCGVLSLARHLTGLVCGLSDSLLRLSRRLGLATLE